MIDTRLKELREVLDLTQREFADQLFISRNTLAMYETGKCHPSQAVLSLICKTFHVSRDWLIDGNGEMFEQVTSVEIQAVADKYQLSPEIQTFIKKLVTLPFKEQAVISKLISDTAEEIKKNRER